MLLDLGAQKVQGMAPAPAPPPAGAAGGGPGGGAPDDDGHADAASGLPAAPGTHRGSWLDLDIASLFFYYREHFRQRENNIVVLSWRDGAPGGGDGPAAGPAFVRGDHLWAF